MSKLAEINAELNALDWDPPLVKCLTVERPKSRRKPKGPTARYRARRKRADDTERLAVRAKCVLRDGACKVSALGGCWGFSEHAHLEEKRRARTMGMLPDERHTVEKSMMLCTRHHRAYDKGRLELAMFADLGAQGPIRATYQGLTVVIPC